MKVLGRHEFDSSVYNNLSLAVLREVNIESGSDYAIFEK